MNRKAIADTLKRKRHNLKQISEALKLVEDLDWKVSWALDFFEHMDINDALNPIQEALSSAQEELEEQQEQLERQIQEYKDEVERMKSEIASEVLSY
jgi:DNA-binding transcriptional MerR regulator